MHRISYDMWSDTGAVDALIKQLEDEDQDVRFAVAEALGKIGDAKAFNALASHSTCDTGYVCIAIDEALHRLNKKWLISPFSFCLGNNI